ncbi:MAG: hypothetical protein LBS87_02370 [Puniceicoccales bacterium]|jgi:hypothetical protein|nr:hypothetical protein [Puniceicoccales bacterium]
MKKLLLTFMLTAMCGLVPCVSFAIAAGDTYMLREEKYVPLFASNGVSFRYKIGFRGMNCPALNTVLPPGSFVKVIDVCCDNTVHVSCKVSEAYSPEGFVHEKFFRHSMEPLDGALFEKTSPVRKILSVEKICEMLDSFRGEEIPYAWGCNNLQELDLGDLYTFVCDDEGGTSYKCVGLDCSGLLHMVSSWLLPHSTVQLDNFSEGRCLCELDANSSKAELKNALDSMLDTDFVVLRYPSTFEGHLIIFLHGGFIEAKGCNFGIVYTDKRDALGRLEELAKDGKVRVVRWHPELLN